MPIYRDLQGVNARKDKRVLECGKCNKRALRGFKMIIKTIWFFKFWIICCYVNNMWIVLEYVNNLVNSVFYDILCVSGIFCLLFFMLVFMWICKDKKNCIKSNLLSNQIAIMCVYHVAIQYQIITIYYQIMWLLHQIIN